MEKSGKELFVGIDVGSSFAHYAVLGAAGAVIYSARPIMHFANPIGAVKEIWLDVVRRFGAESIRSTAFTGSGAESFDKVMEGVSYIFDSVAIPKGAETANPDAQYIFHMGAKDSYFFHVKAIGAKKVIQEWRTGTKCGGGSGTLIEKQCRRLFEGEVAEAELEETGSAQSGEARQNIWIRNREKLQARLQEMFARAQMEAEGSAEPSEFLARCGVVIQSDLIHKQNEGATRRDNLAGLFRTVARNYKIDVLGAREFGSEDSPCAIATGGVFTNDLIRKNAEEFLGITIERSEQHHNIAAIGAAAKAIEEDNKFVFTFEQLDEVAAHGRENRKFAPALSTSLQNVNEENEDLGEDIEPGTEVVLGIDGGSTTTKGALVELSTGRLLDKLYIKTHGNPEESLKKV
ncbi:MAG: BadF/BadG/BcrA/BcrD ATPase family protein, partial [Planctomycetota bacterium]